MLVMSQNGRIVLKEETITKYKIGCLDDSKYNVYAFNNVSGDHHYTLMASYTKEEQAIYSLATIMRATSRNDNFVFPTDNPKWSEK